MIDLRQTHPNLYGAYTVYAVMVAALGLNFLILNPAFDPLDIPKQIPGVAFLSLGLAQFVALNVWRNAFLLRLTMAAVVALMFFWCGALIFDFLRYSQTSLQLPLTYAGLGALALPLLIEPPTNPATQTNGKSHE